MIQTFTTKFLFKKELAPKVWLFRFDVVSPTAVEFTAGQYLITKIPSEIEVINPPPAPGRFYRRHYSIASSSFNKNRFELVIEMIENGVASTYYQHLKIGDEVLFDGPAGVFTSQSADKTKIFLATGTGIAPIKSILNTYLSSNFKAQMSNQIQSTKYHLFWGLRKIEDVYFLDELKELSEKNPNFKFKICLSRQENMVELDKEYFCQGRINEHISDFLNEDSLKTSEFYISGERIIVESLRQFLLNLNITREQIFFEKF